MHDAARGGRKMPLLLPEADVLATSTSLRRARIVLPPGSTCALAAGRAFRCSKYAATAQQRRSDGTNSVSYISAWPG